MLISALDRWLDERGLVVDVEAPYYTIVLYPPGGRTLLTAEGTTLTEAFEQMLALADERQRQAGERWALRENPAFHVTTDHLDELLEERGQYLGLQAGAEPRYAAYLVARDGSGASRAIFGETLEGVSGAIAVATPRPVKLGDLERQYRALAGHGLGAEPGFARTEVRHRRRLPGRPSAFSPIARHRAVALARVTSPMRASKELGIPRSTLREWISQEAESEPAPIEVLHYADVATLVEDLGSVQAAARELGRPVEEVAQAYYRDERLVRRAPLETMPSVTTHALETAREYGVREASRQFGVDEDTLREALVAPETR